MAGQGNSHARVLLAACLCLISIAALTGCASLSRGQASVLWHGDAVPLGFSSSVRTVGDTQQSFMVRSAQLLTRARAAAGDGPINILALSGGGAGGAFGAGALVGWTRQGTRPEFQIVTGVSAGALIAPFAFLGPSWDVRLTEAFSGARTERLLQPNGLGALFGASVYRGEPLVALVDSYVTDELLHAIAIEAAKGRQLVVATTDLDKEQTVIWNLSALASQGGEPARRLFRDVLVAAASIPGVFPPVIIRVEESGEIFDEMHVDGATTASLFIAPEIAGYLTDPLHELQGANLYVIVNGQLGTVTQTTSIATLKIARRGLAAVLQSNARADFAVASAFAQRNGMTVSVTDIPEDYAYGGPLDLRRSRMKSLFNFAFRCAAQEQLWATPLEIMERADKAHLTLPEGLITCPGPAQTTPNPSLQTAEAPSEGAAISSASIADAN
jgi:hypothetical protein